jgi:hypothetical protein
MRHGKFPFGQLNTIRPMRTPVEGPAKVMIVGVYPSAFHVSWKAPAHLRRAASNGGGRRTGGLLGPVALGDCLAVLDIKGLSQQLGVLRHGHPLNLRLSVFRVAKQVRHIAASGVRSPPSLSAAYGPANGSALSRPHESAWFAVTLDLGDHSLLWGTGAAIDLGDLLGRQHQVALVAVLGR